MVTSENQIRTYGRTKKYVDQSAIKFTDLLNLIGEDLNVKKTTEQPEAQAPIASRSKRAAAKAAAENLKYVSNGATASGGANKRKSGEELSRKHEVKLFQSSSSSSASSTSSREQIDENHFRAGDAYKRTSCESATATEIINSANSIVSTIDEHPKQQQQPLSPLPLQHKAIKSIIKETLGEVKQPVAAPVSIRAKRAVKIPEKFDVQKVS